MQEVYRPAYHPIVLSKAIYIYITKLYVGMYTHNDNNYYHIIIYHDRWLPISTVIIINIVGRSPDDGVRKKKVWQVFVKHKKTRRDDACRVLKL